MIRTSEIETLLLTGGIVVDPSGAKIGDIKQIFLDDDSGQAAWVTVSTGRFGAPESVVPLIDGVLNGTEIQVPYDRNKVKQAVPITAGAGLPSAAEAARLYAFYGCPGPTDEFAPSVRSTPVSTRPPRRTEYRDADDRS
jgi:sporulation protein YlmC with PRC-barrel domain